MSHTPASIESKTLAGDVEEREHRERETPYEHLAVRDIDSVHEDVDPRLSLSSRPSAEELDESIPKHLAHTLSGEYPHHHHHTDSKTRAEDVGVDADLEKKAASDERSQQPSSARDSEEIFYVGTWSLLFLR